jgi:hypothetical protein
LDVHTNYVADSINFGRSDAYSLRSWSLLFV